MILNYQTSAVSFSKIEKLREQGENSSVYLVHDQHLKANLAVKEIKTDGFNDAYFLEEAQNLYKSSHPNVVQILYASKDATHIYIAMPYYSRGSLGALAIAQRLTVRQIIRYAIQFLSGLNNVHSKGLIHFDIKPDNILISDNNEALLSDFGYTKNMDEDGFATPDAIYTHHLPPEAVSTRDFDNRADIYQVGLTLYRLLVGDKSIEEQRNRFSTGAEFARAQRDDNFPDKRAYPPHIPNHLKTIINKCLRYDPEKRYDSVIQLVNDLAMISNAGLDWLYSESQKTRRWDAILTNGQKLLVLVDDKGACHSAKCKHGGEYRKVAKLCFDRVTEEEIHGILMSEAW